MNESGESELTVNPILYNGRAKGRQKHLTATHHFSKRLHTNMTFTYFLTYDSLLYYHTQRHFRSKQQNGSTLRDQVVYLFGLDSKKK
jgi:hypothetical protein